MMRSMFSAVSGLKVHQTKMDVIGNNIANVNTVGFKADRVTFSDVFSQTIQSASGASDDTGRGGLNPMQVGLGVTVSSIDTLMTQGAAERTDNSFDMMVDGGGFIVVSDATGVYFTRAGALRTDVEGNLVNSSGYMVQGWASQYNKDTNEYEIVQGEVQNINLSRPELLYSSPSATTDAKITGNLDSTKTEATTTIDVYDSLGNVYTATVEMKKGTAAGTWSATVTKLTDAAGKEQTLPATKPTVNLTFDTDGKLTSTDKLTFTFTGEGASEQDVAIDFAGMTQYAAKTDLVPKAVNGNEAAAMSGYSIDSKGVITAYYNNGDTRVVAQVPVANFVNSAGLEKVGDSLYRSTANSGTFDGIGEAGSFQTGVLEMSNVDLSTEFTQMIVTQRGYQANSRIISVSDEMLQELVNIK